jgi:5'-deoxynucleotidase YfbR-like HD superfamily hydrolase
MRAPTPDTTRFGGYVLTYAGGWFYPLDPRPEDVVLEDVAQGLALKCRWSGLCNRHYSIAEHCLTVSALAEFLARRDGKSETFAIACRNEGLVHDGNEAYLPDIPGPIKRYIEGWKDREHKVDAAIHKKLLMPEVEHEVEVYVKWADLMVLALEQEQLFSRRLTPEELYNNYEMRELWPGYPTISTEIRRFMARDAFWRRLRFWKSVRSEYLGRLYRLLVVGR